MNRINRNHSGTPLHPADGNVDPIGPTSEDGLWPGHITSSAWEGWWWGNPAEEPAMDTELGTIEGSWISGIQNEKG
jgi:hypothetical protein